MGAKTAAEVEEFLNSAPMLINEAKSGKYDSAFMANYIIGKLTGGAFDLLVCQHCGAKFTMVKRGQKYRGEPPVSIPAQCPDCGFLNLYVETSLATTLKKELGPEKPIVVTKPVVIKPGKIIPEGKDDSETPDA